MEELIKRSEVNIEDTWDLSAYYKTDEDFLNECTEIEEKINNYEKFTGHLSDNAKVLYECLCFNDSILNILDKIVCYAYQKQDEDTSVGKYQEFYGKAIDLLTKTSEKSAFIVVEISSMSWESLDKMIEELSELSHYKRFIEQIKRVEKYTKSEAEEKILVSASTVTSAASEIFKMFNNADIKFEDVSDSNGVMHSISHGNFIKLLGNDDRTLRKNVYKSFYKTYLNSKNTLSAMMQANLKEHSFYAKIKGYDSPVQYSLYQSSIPVEVYYNLIKSVRDALPSMYEYVSLRKKVLGIEDLHIYDSYVPIVDMPQKKYSFEEAKAIVLNALKPMGTEYTEILEKGMNSRWIDVYENKGKRSGAYSTSAYGTHPYVLLNYTGNISSVFTLAHEMGHAMHSWFSDNNQSFTYAGYKLFVAEVASTCNEALLSNYLLKEAKTEKEKAYIINNYIDSFKSTLFRQTMFAEFELEIHNRVWNGEVMTSEKFCNIYRKLNEDYFGSDMIIDDEISMEWSRIPHFYRPFYVYQYATGFSAAIALSTRILKLGAEGVADYMKFLKGGSSKDPIDLLKMAGVDMTTGKPVDDAMKVFADLVHKLKDMLD